MNSNTVMNASGQVWKFYLATILIWTGIGTLIFGILGKNYFVLFGLLIGLSGIAFSCLAIRCPECGQRWYWQSLKRSIKESKFGWVKRLFSQTECQSCGYGHADAA